MFSTPQPSIDSQPADRHATAARTPIHYEIVAGVAASDQEKAVALWRRSGFGEVHNEMARYEWFYLRNPQGEGQINFLTQTDHEQPVGFLGVGHRGWMVEDARITAGVLVDFVVHPEHRTAVPALMLQRRSRERASNCAAILYGLPDTKAVAIFKRIGSEFRCQLPRYVRILRSRTYLRRHVAQWLARPLASFTDTLDLWGMQLQLLLSADSGQWIDRFDESFDELWARLDKRRRCLGVRDRQFLDWRFSQQPGHCYRIFAIRQRSTGALQAYFVCELTADTLVIKDCLCLGSESELRRALLLISRAARALGAVAISIQISADAAVLKALHRTQFIERDSRPFFAMLSEGIRERTAGMSWYVTQADEDI